MNWQKDMEVLMDFPGFFRKATTYPHYPYQERLAQAQGLPTLVVADRRWQAEGRRRS